MNVLPNPPHLSGAPWYHSTSHVEIVEVTPRNTRTRKSLFCRRSVAGTASEWRKMREWLGNCHVLFVEILLLYELLAISSNLHCLPFSQKNNNIVLNPNFVSARGRGGQGVPINQCLMGFAQNKKNIEKTRFGNPKQFSGTPVHSP